MRYAFRSFCTVGASFLSVQERTEIVRQAVMEVEKISLFHDSVVLVDVAIRRLKVVVQFARREIHIMTAQEAKDAGFPMKPDHSRPSEN
jgi:hypothetical protein